MAMSIQLDLDGLIRFHQQAISSSPQSSTAPLSSDSIDQALTVFLEDMGRGKSGFFDLPVKTRWPQEWETLKPILASRIPEVDTVLHMGIGGSSLGAETLVQALSGPVCPQFHFVDNIDPDALHRTLARIQPQKLLVYVVTKSGGTFETVAGFMVVWEWLEKHLGAEEAKRRLVFCTDPSKGDLRKLSDQWKLPCFEIPTSLGGRFSALSAVGLFPTVLAGAQPSELLKGAAQARHRFLEAIGKGHPPDVLKLATLLVDLYRRGLNNTVLMPYSQKLKTLSAWFVQLWAESLGKKGQGLTPVGAVGATDQHSLVQLLKDGPVDKTLGFVEVRGFDALTPLRWKGPDLPAFRELDGISMNQLMDAEYHATREALVQSGKPCFSWILPKLNEIYLGELLFEMETLTALSGYLMDVDPFDQPGVEDGKILTRQRIAACKRAQNA